MDKRKASRPRSHRQEREKFLLEATVVKQNTGTRVRRNTSRSPVSIEEHAKKRIRHEVCAECDGYGHWVGRSGHAYPCTKCDENGFITY